MPRNRVKVSYTKAERTPSVRARERIEPDVHPDYVPVAKTPKGLSPLAQYVEDNLDSGISVLELIEQFQEFDCDHPDEYESARSPAKISFTCPACGRVRHSERP